MSGKLTTSLALLLSTGIAFADDPKPTPLPEPEKPKEGENLQGSTSGERKWAEGVSDADQKLALELFEQGNNALSDGIPAEAATKYREALKHWKHPAIHYNLALALLTQEQPLEVYQNFVASVKYGEAPLDKGRFDKANEYIKILESTAIATIEVSCQKAGAEIMVDGRKVLDAPGKHIEKVKAGKHVFACEPGPGLQGYTTKVRAPFIDPGTKYRVELKLYTTDELTRYKRRWETRTWAPWAVVGAGVVVAGVGGVLALSAQSSFDDYDSKIAKCNSDSGANLGCNVMESGFRDLKDSGDTKRTMSYVGYGVGAGAVALGLTLVYLNRKTAYQIRGEDYEEELENKAAAQPRVSVTPMISNEIAGAMVVGSF